MPYIDWWIYNCYSFMSESDKSKRKRRNNKVVDRVVNCPYCTKQFTFPEDLTEITFPSHGIDHCSERASFCRLSNQTFQITGETGTCSNCGSEGLFVLTSEIDGRDVKIFEGHSRNGGKEKIPDGFWQQAWENKDTSNQLNI